jgi:NAD(P)-dependent dehydrogenase (short-subunit alcohol dehydrogenase family)
VSAVEIDVSSDDSIAAAAATIQKDFGRVDVLINNAGSLFENPVTPVVSRELFRKTYEVNVYGAAACTEAFITLLSNSAVIPPRLIFISSRMGSLATRADPSSHNNFPIYRSSKSALNMLAEFPYLKITSFYGSSGAEGCVRSFLSCCLRSHAISAPKIAPSSRAPS